jgi:outer membrane protein assembly factor BamB
VVRGAGTTRYCAFRAVTIVALTVASGFCPQSTATAQRPDDTRRKEIARMFRDAKPSPAPFVATEAAWKVTLPAVPTAAAAMDDVHVYVPISGNLLIALDRETGVLAWTRSIETASPPAVGDGAIYIVSPGAIRALEADTGQDRWSLPLETAVTTPLVWQHGWLIAVQGAELLALRAADGRLIWRQPLGSTPAHSPVLYGSSLYLSLANGEITAIRLETGAIVWQRRLPGVLSQPAVAKDRVLVGSDDNFLYAFDAETGREAWKWRNGGDVVGAAADGDVVYFASLDNIVRAVNRTNGNQRWRKPTGTRPLMAPRAFAGIVVLPGLKPAITVFVGETGAVMGTQAVQGQLVGAPLIDTALKARRVSLVTVTREGVVEALRPAALMFREEAVVPVAALPGRSLTRERMQ